ncbi:TetR/AcrR family transcriptional regulator [Mycobacteroides chelonae]|uniref:TetR/AcrR family transcriptional regulator n=1 Tax=Mycobacteroides chelonae TaxID=1774 RepID=UPI000992B684|nr:TetR/AcrR family transcriptional regulator [Mycobacteroides chelonae]
MTSREEQKQATRARVLDAATNLLVTQGYSALTTVAVQEAAGVSRGALLHHFPTAAELTRALVANLVESNETVARAAAMRIGRKTDAVERALTALLESMTHPAAQAEFELWAAARTDPALAEVLIEAERRAGRDLRRVVDDLFGPEIVAHQHYPVIRDLSITMLRGMALSRSLRTSDRAVRTTLTRWADTVRTLLTLSPA